MSPDDLDDRELAHTALTPAKPVTSDGPKQLQLVVIGTGSSFATHTLTSGTTVTIGRSNRCNICIDETSISRRHATLVIGDTITIEDLGSANGTRVRGTALKPGAPAFVSIGELVGVGQANIIIQQQSRQMRPRRIWSHDDFEARLEEECAREKRSGAAFAVLRISTDRRAPAGYAEDALVELLRESDIIGKYGPHEYELLLPDLPPEKSEEAAVRIERKLNDRGLSARISVKCCPRDGRSAYQLSATEAGPTSQRPVNPSGDIVVSDPQMRSLYWLVDQVAGSSISVLLLGETGVGKEVFARAIHRASPRASGPFVDLNCAALTDTLLESELFGHEKGAFTHASAAKPGLIETAHGGTLFLDEIGDMPLGTQVKLLRVLEDSQLRRVGALKSRTVDVRFVAATNADLETQVANGTFRQDLYFRLNGVTIVIPPLRERMPELEPLANSFIRRASPESPPSLSPEALELMRAYSWPGNVRELRNMMERATLLSGGRVIRADHLPAEKMRGTRMTGNASSQWPTQPPATNGTSPPRRGSEEEQRRILQALERSGGNQTHAAKLLGISRRTLVNRLNELDVHRPRKDRKPI